MRDESFVWGVDYLHDRIHCGSIIKNKKICGCRGCGRTIPLNTWKYEYRVFHQYGPRSLFINANYCLECAKKHIAVQLDHHKTMSSKLKKAMRSISNQKMDIAAKEMAVREIAEKV